MAESFKIDIEINAHDNTGNAAQSAQSKMTGFEKSVERTNAQLKKLSGSRTNVNINAQDRASRIIENIAAKLKSVGSKAYNFTISAIDKATSIVSNLGSRLQGFVGRVYNATVGALDRASPVLKPITSRLQSLAGRAYDVTISAIDRATTVITGVGSRLQSFAGRAWQTTLSVIDRATSIVTNITNKVSSVASKAWSVAVSAVDRASSVISKITSAVKGVASKAWQVTISVLDRATEPIRGIINLLKNPLITAGTVLGIGSVAKSTFDNGLNFEAGMSKVKAISGASVTDTERLKKEALAQASKTVFTPTETTEALTYMGMAGWKAQEMIAGLPAVLDLAAAGGTDLATTSDIVTDAITAFGMKASDATHFADVMAAASTNANTNVSLMGETFKYAGSLAGTLGYSIDDVALATGLMASASVKGTQAGTAIRTGLVNLAKPSKDMKSVMDKYGLSLTDAEGNMKSFRTILEDVRGAFKGAANEADEAGDLAKLFGKYGLAGWAAVVNASEEDFNQLADAIDNSNGVARNMRETMLDNLQGDITLFKSAWEVAQDKVMESVSPILRHGVQSMTEIIQNLPEKIEKASKKLNAVMDLFSDNPTKLMQSDPEMWERYVAAGMPTTIGGKLSFAWNELIVNPLSEWWNNGGKETVAGVFNGGGALLGASLSGGIMALFGLTSDGVVGEGMSLAGSFIQGFKEGFDGQGVVDAIKKAFTDHPIEASVLSYFLFSNLTGIKLTDIIGKWIERQMLKRTIQQGMGGNGTGTWTTETMSVNASVVNVYGQNNGNPTGQGTGNGSGTPIPSGGGTSTSSGGALPPANTGSGGSAPTSLPSVNTPTAGAGGGAWALPAAGGAAAFGAAGAGAAKVLGTGAAAASGSQLLLPAAAEATGAGAAATGAATGAAEVLTADAILGASGEVIATGSELAAIGGGATAGGAVAAIGSTAAIGALAVPIFSAFWDASGLNPKNYTWGQKTEQMWKDSGMNPDDYGVDPRKVPPTRFKETELKPALNTDKKSGSKKSSVWSNIMDFLFPSAAAAEIDEVGEQTGSKATESVANGAEKAIESSKGSNDVGKKFSESLFNGVGEELGNIDLSEMSIGEQLMTAIGASLEGMDEDALSDLNIGEQILSAIGESMDTMDFDGIEIGEQLMSAIGEAVDTMDFENITIGASLMSAIGESLDTIDFENVSIGESLMGAISQSLDTMDLGKSGIGETVMSAISAALDTVDFESIDIGSKISESISASLANADISGAIEPIIEQLNALNEVEVNPTLTATDDASEIITMAQELADTFGATTATAILAANDGASSTIQSVQTALDNLNGKTATVTVNIQTNGSLPAGVHFASGTKDAPGGWGVINDQRGGRGSTELYDNGKALMEFGGRDVAIPIAKHARIYTAEQRERMLSALNAPHYKEGLNNDEDAYMPYQTVGNNGDFGNGGGNGTTMGDVNVDVTVSPTIEITSQGGDEAKIVAVIKSHMGDIADEAASKIADNLVRIFPNIPTKGETY